MDNKRGDAVATTGARGELRRHHIEWHDFFLYGAAAPLGIYGAGFVARPVGGGIFGHYGDRIGRKTMLVTSLMMMGIATFLAGLLPTTPQIGIWAPILLVVLGMFQGLGAGVE